MKRLVIAGLLVLMAPLCVSASDRPDEAIETARQVEKAFEHVAKTVRPAVVTIVARPDRTRTPFPFGAPGEKPDAPSPFSDRDRGFENFFDRFFKNRPGPNQPNQSMQGLGSGMIVRSNGYILTNNHVVQNASDINVRLHDGETLSASVVGTDDKTDLAVLKIDREELPTVDFANSDRVNVGQYAIAIGSPFQMENSVSVGHVSAKNRSVNVQEIEDLIQTDAAINQGNSGGPLVDIDGNVIGVNTLIISQGMGNQGVGFAIASNLARRTVRDILKYGDVKRPWLGVAVQKLTSDMKKHFDTESGVIIADVLDETPADRAGLKAGDVIVSLDDEPIDGPSELQRHVLSHEVGESVNVTLYREGSEQSKSVTLSERSEQKTVATTDYEKKLGEDYGLRVRKADAEQLDNSSDAPALQVVGVRQFSPAKEAGLRPGDLIKSANNKRVDTPEQFARIVTKAEQNDEDSVLLHVKREQSLFVSLPVP